MAPHGAILYFEISPRLSSVKRHLLIILVVIIMDNFVYLIENIQFLRIFGAKLNIKSHNTKVNILDKEN
jgi:hypothetical protein